MDNSLCVFRRDPIDNYNGTRSCGDGMMAEKKKVALYIRVSTDKQDALNQVISLKDYCNKSDYNIFNEYIDIISGKEPSRPAYDLMFQHAHKKYFDIVLFWDLSRFSRAGTLFTLQKLKELENLGIDWESYQEPYFKSAGQFKDVVLSIISTIAKMEREKISERTKAGLRHAKNVGKRGADKKPRKRRSDCGIKRGAPKTDLYYLNKLRIKEGRF